MNLPRDFQDFLRSLNAQCVEYAVVGGYAVALHGYPRLTGERNRAGKGICTVFVVKD
jgi:hypothetical protein